MSNPYEPPRAPLATSQKRRGFHWRLIASVAPVVSGAPLVLLALSAIVTEVFDSVVVPGRAVPVLPIMIGIGIFIAGGLWIVSGGMFWKRRWWIGVVLLIVGYAVFVFTLSYMR